MFASEYHGSYCWRKFAPKFFRVGEKFIFLLMPMFFMGYINLILLMPTVYDAADVYFSWIMFYYYI